jgi:hypothetical protein
LAAGSARDKEFSGYNMERRDRFYKFGGAQSHLAAACCIGGRDSDISRTGPASWASERV